MPEEPEEITPAPLAPEPEPIMAPTPEPVAVEVPENTQPDPIGDLRRDLEKRITDIEESLKPKSTPEPVKEITNDKEEDSHNIPTQPRTPEPKRVGGVFKRRKSK